MLYDTGEYFFYNLQVTTGASDVLETIRLESPIRQITKHIITIENPLKGERCDVSILICSSHRHLYQFSIFHWAFSSEKMFSKSTSTLSFTTLLVFSIILMITYHLPTSASTPVSLHPSKWWTCDAASINVLEALPLNGNPEGSYEINYRPLLITSEPVDAILTISTKELGTFKYRLILTAAPLVARRSIRFEVPLGNIQTESFLLRAFNSVKSDFSCSVTNTQCLSVPKVR